VLVNFLMRHKMYDRNNPHRQRRNHRYKESFLKRFTRLFFQSIAAILITGTLGIFFAWVMLNWMSGCCEGGICIPEWVYPQCQESTIDYEKYYNGGGK